MYVNGLPRSHEVTKLMRVAFGPIELGRLLAGEWREVDMEEMTEVTGFTTKERSQRGRTKKTIQAGLK
jgi:hypothetical protein